MDRIALLLGVLRDGDADARRRAVEALGTLGDARAVEPLVHALDDEDERVQWSAAQALERIGSLETLAALAAWRAT
jgi:HEAT repeat protein